MSIIHVGKVFMREICLIHNLANGTLRANLTSMNRIRGAVAYICDYSRGLLRNGVLISTMLQYSLDLL